MPAFCICNENHEKQDLAIFHPKTISLFLKYFYIVNSVIKGRHALLIFMIYS
ncbi:hypothetical protein [Moraxella lacunata]|uniref:hypothetical protein n=1 Tax=Moraxella lacunata TaxID=477 RepID=UPI003EDF2E9D